MYSNCGIEIANRSMIHQIFIWQRINDVLLDIPLPPNIKTPYDMGIEIPYNYIENLKIFEEREKMSMADVIRAIPQDMYKRTQAHEIGGLDGMPIDCSTLADKPVIKADNETDRQIQK